jgi:predicted homoserine dehydrogenase-like protein
MIYGNLLAKLPQRPAVKVGIIGAGHYGTAIITQSGVIPHYAITFVADMNLGAAKKACTLAGWDADSISVVETEADVRRARSLGKVIVTASPELISACDVEVLIEATGNADAGAAYAIAAIGAGRHVVMVNKETDSVVGPILAHKANAAGLVYTQADGDQPALIIALCDWAKLLGLEIVAAGKSHDKELLIDREAKQVRIGTETFPLEEGWIEVTRSIDGDAARTVEARRMAFGAKIATANYDRLEIVCIANATGLAPRTGPHAEPILRTPEIPQALCLTTEGGLLERPGVLDTVCCLREPQAPTMGGGVFVVVRCKNAYSREILHTKGLIANRARSVGMIYRPYHLCGVETPISIIAAARLGVATGARESRPQWDVIAVAKKDLKAGTVLGRDLEYSDQLDSVYESHRATKERKLLPLGMTGGLCLTEDVTVGMRLTEDMVEIPPDALLWRLRREQDALFGRHSL